jgi:LPS sulfotransferase NodH
VSRAVKNLLPTYALLDGPDYVRQIGSGSRIALIKSLPEDTQWVLHCNWCEILKFLPKDTVVIRPYRRDQLAVAFSMFLAEYTGEYGAYTDKQFDPIFIDPNKIGKWLRQSKKRYQEYNRLAESVNINIINVCFEDILADLSDQILADLIGVKNSKIETTVGLHVLKNTRKASDLIINYQQLCEQFGTYRCSSFD